MRFPQSHIQPVIVPLAQPNLTNDHLAMKLQQNWLAKNPMMEHLTQQTTKDTLDDSLTSLNWLQNMNLNIGDPTPPVSPRQPAGLQEVTRVNPNHILATNMMDQPSPLIDIKMDAVSSTEKIDYKTNPYVKPPYSYATLICMAMKESKKAKVTLSAIYNWITDHFMYYRMADPSWQNSIRHNLSLNKCFQKVARRKDEPGKGGFWRINPDYNALLDNGVLKKRKTEGPTKRNSTDDIEEIVTPKKRGKGKSQRDETAEAALSITELLNLDKLLSQDINVAGVRLKTEDIIDEDSMVTLSPPSSDDSSTFDDLLGPALGEVSSQSGSSINIQGVKIEPPEWWTDSLTSSGFNGLLNSSGQFTIGMNSDESHPWSTNKSDIDDAMAALDDMEKLLGSSFN